MQRCLSMLGMAAAAVLLGGCEPSALGGSPPGSAVAAKKSVTVFPVVIKPELSVGKAKDGTQIDFAKRLAGVVGLMLEKAGIEDVEIAETRFNSPDTDDVGQIAAALAKLVRERPIKTDFAFYGEILGTPKTGPTEIRTVIVDRQGKVILADRDDSKTYARTSDMTPKDPMSCCVFIARKAQKLWGLADPLREDAPSGKMAARMRKQSGLPPEEEFAAIKERFDAIADTAKFAVYPVKIGSETDKQCAAQLVEMLNQQNICRAVVADAEVKLKIQGDPNEQKVLWDTARAFRDFVRKNKPTEDYTVLADYAIHRSSSGETQVRYVHVIACDRAGDWVIVDFQNSHHPDFQAIGPKSREDCNRLVIRRARAAFSGQ